MVSPVPKNKGLPDLMSGDLRWAWGINNRNKVMHLNHPETIPTPISAPSMEKLSSTKPVPGAKKVGYHCPRRSGR